MSCKWLVAYSESSGVCTVTLNDVWCAVPIVLSLIAVPVERL